MFEFVLHLKTHPSEIIVFPLKTNELPLSRDKTTNEACIPGLFPPPRIICLYFGLTISICFLFSLSIFTLC